MIILIGRLESTVGDKSCVTFVDDKGIEYVAEVSYKILSEHGVSEEGDKFSIIFDNSKDPVIKKLENKVKLTKEEVKSIKEEIAKRVGINDL